MNIVQGLRRVSKRDEYHVHMEDVPRRSSVAIVVRVPGFKADQALSITEVLDKLDKQSNAQHAELLFIKRAASERDRWSSHIAVPGGRRDPEDESDLACAVRETFEEVGLDLNKGAAYVGPLDQRLVKVSFGSRAIMTLCPFVFLMTDEQELAIQPTEVATAFWIPIAKLLDPSNASYEQITIGDRVANKSLPGFVNKLIKYSISDLLFGSVTLNPTEFARGSNAAPPPYKLWGLTLGFLTDFFELISPGRTVKSISMPTFKAWDMRFVQWIITRRYLHNQHTEITLSQATGYHAGQMDYISKLLDGYFWYLRATIKLSLVIRAGCIAAVIYKLFRYK